MSDNIEGCCLIEEYRMKKLEIGQRLMKLGSEPIFWGISVIISVFRGDGKCQGRT